MNWKYTSLKKTDPILTVISMSVLLAFIPVNDEAAVRFLNSLNPAQRESIQLTFDDQSKTDWHFFPASMLTKEGLPLSELNTGQKQLLNILLQHFISETGYIKTKKIIELENVLADISGDRNMRDSEKYFVAFYGHPEKDELWAWSFEGHHLSLNFTVWNDKISAAPRFLGASPATILSGPRKGQRTLDKEEDLGLELINALSEDQKKIAIFQKDPIREIVTFNASKVDPLKPVGIKFGALNKQQQELFVQLLDEYLSTMPQEQATARLENIKNENMDEVRYGWAGATVSGSGHYYRIQGKSFLVEFDNVQENANHIHTVWRDFDGDFGRDLIREHYQKSHHVKE